MHHIESQLLEARILIALLIFDLTLNNRHALIDSRSKRSSLAAGAAGSEPPRIICDMRFQPPERLVLDEEADGFEGVVGSTGKLVDGRDRHIQPADETIERGFELFQGKAEVRQFATMGLREVPFSISSSAH